MRFFVLLPGLLALTACRHHPEAPPSVSVQAVIGPVSTAEDLPALIAARLQLAREVAWTKFNSGAPVLDPAREAALLADLVAQGRERGLDPAAVEKFFTAQIAASREVQTGLIAAWRAGSSPRPSHAPLDLRTEIRPRLDALTPRFLAARPAFSSLPDPSLADATARELTAAGFSPAVVALATAPLRP